MERSMPICIDMRRHKEQVDDQTAIRRMEKHPK